MTITLKRAAVCRGCGAHLSPGTRASWYRSGAVYGLNCHTRGHEPLGQKLSRQDPRGFYTADGRLLGRIHCGCEDYPCCGH